MRMMMNKRKDNMSTGCGVVGVKKWGQQRAGKGTVVGGWGMGRLENVDDEKEEIR